MRDLRQIISKYLDKNGIKTKFFAAYIGCEYGKCVKKLKGEGRFTSSEIQKIYDFLDGKHLISVEQIVKEGQLIEDRTGCGQPGISGVNLGTEDLRSYRFNRIG